MATIDPATLTIKGRNAEAVITCLNSGGWRQGDGERQNLHVQGRRGSHQLQRPSRCGAQSILRPVVRSRRAAARLAKAIMSGDSTLTAAVEADTASPPLMTKVRVKVRTPGTAGNAYTLTETGSAVTVSGATFTGGVAAAVAGFVSSVSLAGKKMLVLWYDKNPGVATAPLMVRSGRGRGRVFGAGKLAWFPRWQGRGSGRRSRDVRMTNRIVRAGNPAPAKPLAANL